MALYNEKYGYSYLSFHPPSLVFFAASDLLIFSYSIYFSEYWNLLEHSCVNLFRNI
jgi:hypothetical protein